MSATIPACVVLTPFHHAIAHAGLRRTHQGKVRDTYALYDDQLLLVVATDRVSIFDFVLPALVPQKGELLTALTVFWLTEILADIHHHLVAYGAGIDPYLPPALRGDAELYKRALVVRRLTMAPVECIVRGYLTGSGWKSYQKTQQVCGIELPEGLYDGSRILPHPIFTPTTKAESGHDEHLPTETVIKRYGAWTRDLSLRYYQTLANVAEAKGIILADTKFEFGDGGVLADEVGTPDSSRFWDREEWLRAAERQASPEPYDKEVVRNWGKQVPTPLVGVNSTVGLGTLNPEDPVHLAFVETLTVPPAILNETAQRYHTVFQRLIGFTLEAYQQTKLGVV
jgi:phosphoribosylaminoimidazole-succinocarboxamide synthase